MPISSRLPIKKKINTVHNLITFSIVFTCDPISELPSDICTLSHFVFTGFLKFNIFFFSLYVMKKFDKKYSQTEERERQIKQEREKNREERERKKIEGEWVYTRVRKFRTDILFSIMKKFLTTIQIDRGKETDKSREKERQREMKTE